jgi:YVTN family beta-propeller protein
MKPSHTLRVIPALAALLGLAFLPSCDNQPDLPPVPGTEGYYVVNEGAYGNNNASLSFYDRAANTISNDVFQLKNSRPLGDQAQSMTLYDGRGYIVVQNSAKVEVIDLSDNSSIKTITDNIHSPRFFTAVSSTKGYLSDWGADGMTGTVKVINLETFSVTKSIAVGKGPNEMLLVDNRLFVPNSGGFGKDNTISVIDIATDAVVKTVEVFDNPNSIQVDGQGKLWVACAGNLVYNTDFSINESASTKGTIVQLDSDFKLLQSLSLATFSYSTASQLDINPDKDIIYFNFDGSVYDWTVSAAPGTVEPLISKGYYGFSVDPFNGDIIGGLAPTFSSAGKIEVNGSDGTLKQTFTVGIAPNSCAFK